MYPRFQNYSFVRNDWVITFNPETVVTELLFAEEAGFRAKAWMVSIRALVGDRSQRKMLIDTIARVTSGGLKKHAGYTTCELWLRDLTPDAARRVIREQGTIYITHVKLVHTATVNILVDTELSRAEFNPVMREADLLKKMRIS
ncbi:hypothetical protein Tco_1506269 [Tanacetum coccineum]